MAFPAEKTKELVHEGQVIYRDWKLDVTAMARAIELLEAACCAATEFVSGGKPRMSSLRAYALSKKAPSAASCSPPGTGCSNESKVTGFVMRFTERVLVSLSDRMPNSTPSMADETGCDVFMAAPSPRCNAPAV